MCSLAPIILFVYNRPFHTKAVLNNLAANNEAKDSILCIFCDGAKPGATQETIQKIKQTRSIARKENRFKQVKIVEHVDNKGLANSIIEGVSKICGEYGSVIVLEDDIVTSPFFLRYMNNALLLYKDIDHVGSINGYWYPTKHKMPETFFLRNQSCWGWATWARAWNLFESDGLKLLNRLRDAKLDKQFDLEGAIQYTKMLEDQILKKNDSWAIRWDASLFLANKLSLYPQTSLVENIGFDGSGIHSNATSIYFSELANEPINLFAIPIKESEYGRKALIHFYKNERWKSRWSKLYSLATISFWKKKFSIF